MQKTAELGRVRMVKIGISSVVEVFGEEGLVLLAD